MKHINHYKIFELKKDYSEYFPISDEDILDLSLEMEDLGFKISISRRFSQPDGLSNQPLTKDAYPIYDIYFRKDDDMSGNHYLYDGSVEFKKIEFLRTFTSVMNKMKMLPIKDSFFATQGSHSYTIRLLMQQLSIDDDSVGFDINKFGDRFYSFVRNMEREMGFKILGANNYGFDDGKGYNIEISTNGIYTDSDELIKKWKNCNEFDNKDQYDDISSQIDSYLSQYSKFIVIRKEFQPEAPRVKYIKSGIFNKAVRKEYSPYSLEYKVGLK